MAKPKDTNVLDEQPSQGGSYIRQPTGELELQERTKPNAAPDIESAEPIDPTV